MTACAAFAQDGGLRLVFGIENRLEYSRNRSLDVPAAGSSFSNVTALSFGLTSATALDRLEFNASGALIAENADDTSGTEFDFGRSALTLAYHREVPSAVFDLTARYRSDDVDTFDDDLADEDAVGTRTEYGAATRLEFGRTAPLGFAIGAGFDVVEYDDTTDPDLVDSRDTRADVAAVLHFSEVVTARLGLRVAHREEDDAAATVTDTLGATASLDYAINQRLDLALELGVVEIETEEFGIIDRTRGPEARIGLTYDMPVGTATAALRLTTDADEGQRQTFEIGRTFETPILAVSASLGLTHSDEGGTDLIGALDLRRALPDGSIGLNVARRARFDDDDDETVKSSVFSLSWDKQVNDRSSVTLDVSYELSDAPSERIEQTEFGAVYRHDLTADWSFNSGVRYRVRHDLDGHAESPTVFVSLSRDFELRP